MILPRLLPAVLLTVQTAFGQLLTPGADRLADYHNWFDPLNPANGLVAPHQPSPGSIDTPARQWSTWRPNLPPTDLSGPILGTFDEIYCEVVFLGCTGTGWGEFGYRLSGAEGAFSTDPSSLNFGAFALPDISATDTLDFYVERTDGTRYYAFEKGRNTAPAADGYWGSLTPLESVRGPAAGNDETFAVFAFSPDLTVAEPELFVFAMRATFFVSAQPVPEPATYGMIGGAALVAGVVLRRRQRRAPAA